MPTIQEVRHHQNFWSLGNRGISQHPGAALQAMLGRCGNVCVIPNEVLVHGVMPLLSAKDHASLCESSSWGCDLVRMHESTQVSSLRGQPVPTSHDELMGTKWRPLHYFKPALSEQRFGFVRTMTQALLLRPGSVRLDPDRVQAVLWVNYHIGYHLLHNLDAITSLSDEDAQEEKEEEEREHQSGDRAKTKPKVKITR